MGELSEQTLRLREWHVAPGGKLVINLTQPPREEDLPRLHDAVNAFVGSLAARSEAQPSGYDGLRQALAEAIEFAEQDWQALTPEGDAMLDRWRAAITFTASLSGGEGGLGAIPEPARLDLNGPPDGDEFLEFKETLSDLRSLRAEHRDLNGGGPGWMTRWLNAWVKADELFANEDEAAWVRQQEDAHG